MAGLLLFGGSFDPVHHGHLIVARAIAEQITASRVILIPSARPPHKQNKQLAPASDRLEMCRLAVAGDSLFEVSDSEIRNANGPNYTLLTVERFRAEVGSDTPLFWLLGMDSLIELSTWYRIDRLADLCTLVTAGRPGYARPDLSGLAGLLSPQQIERIARHILPSPLVQIEATQIRARIAAGQSVRYLVAEAVRGYIERTGLYSQRPAAP